MTLFASRVQNPRCVTREVAYALTNLPGANTNAGLELLATLDPRPFVFTATYNYVRSREREQGRPVDVALTRRHNLGLVAMWKREDIRRVGAEFFYTGRQGLERNP